MTTRAQVVSISTKQIAVVPLVGEYADKLYGFPSDRHVTMGQFVPITILNHGRSAEWATTS